MRVKMPESVLDILRELMRAGYDACAVGGCVRDALMGRVPVDWDVCTAARPEEIQRVFAGERVIKTGVRHGTVTVVWRRMPIEITTFRVDGVYTDHRRPDAVRFVTTLEDDLSRRDFTINAMAMRLRGPVIDLFGGREDIAARVVRAVGEPARRFSEDALRMMRALRLMSQLDFTVEEETAQTLHAMKGELKFVSAERVYHELKRMLVGPGAARVIEEFLPVLRVVLPVGAPDARAIACAPESAPARLAMLLRGADVGAALRALRADTATVELAVRLDRFAGEPTPDDEREMRRLLARVGDPNAVFLLMGIWRAEGRDTAAAVRALAALRRAGLCYRIADLAIGGGDLMALGVPEGAEVGRLLKGLLERVIEGETPNQFDALIDAARLELAGSSSE